MADRIYIRAWKKDKNTSVADREIVYVRDEEALYIGTPNGTVKFVSENYVNSKIAELNARIDALTPS